VLLLLVCIILWGTYCL